MGTKAGWISLVCVSLSSCGGSAAPPPEAAPGCNPIIGDDCLTPFPSSFFEVPDAATKTGVRLSLSGKLPVSGHGTPFETSRIDRKDGFSPAMPIVVYFKQGIDPASFAAAASTDSPAPTLESSSPVQVIEYATGARVPLFAELDINASPADGDRQSLLIHPLNRLKGGTRYVVALRGLQSSTGQDLTAAPFRALRDGTPLSNSLMPLADRYREIFGALDKAAVPRSSLTLAWDFVTGSDEKITSHLVDMRDAVLPMADAGTLDYTIDKTTEPNDPHLFRDLIGTFRVPSFLTGDDNAATLNMDESGAPKLRGLGSARFVVHVPRCALTATKPLPILVFGHGLFGNAEDELSTEYQKQLADRLCMVQLGTDWIGLSTFDVPTVVASVAGDLNNFHIVTDRLQQAHVNTQVMTRLFVKKIKNDPALAINGAPVSSGEMYFYGISNGGVQGAVFMSLSPDVARGVLNVPGSEWSLMMYRSGDFSSLKPLLRSLYPDSLDQQILVSILQLEWDYTDPINFAPHLLHDPFVLPGRFAGPGNAPKQVIIQESIGDAQVPNLTTRILARAIGLPGLDLEQKVYGIEEKTGPLDSAYTQWDVHPMPLPPAGNTSLKMDNGAHEAIRRLDLLQEQLKQFFRPDGQVVQTCKGPCSF